MYYITNIERKLNKTKWGFKNEKILVSYFSPSGDLKVRPVTKQGFQTMLENEYKFDIVNIDIDGVDYAINKKNEDEVISKAQKYLRGY